MKMAFTWKNPAWVGKKDIHIVWSDHMILNNIDQYETARQSTVGDTGQDWDSVAPPQVENFLSAYFQKKVGLQAIRKQQNAALGFPVWGFVYEAK
ncbi:MAG: hypothetical protein K9G62_08055 [Alphaproteobacteria bacterium]|nr:hypothetical protein [Alphaproteobacteria bacterium]